LQIWILPERKNLEPGYEQMRIPSLQSGWQLLVSPDRHEGSLLIHQQARIWEGNFKAGDSLRLNLTLGNDAWIQGVRGSFEANGFPLSAGDGASMTGVDEVRIEGVETGRLLLFELA